MGARGPVKRPAKVAVLHGERKSRMAPQLPETTKTVTPPSFVTNAGKVWWRRWAPGLLESGKLTYDTAPAFGLLCESMVTLVSAIELSSKAILVAGENTRGGRAALVRNPAVAIARDQHEVVRRWLREFGLTPEGMNVPEVPRGELYDILAGPGPVGRDVFREGSAPPER